MPEVPLERDDTEGWTLFTDGASSLKVSGAGLVLIGPSGIEYTYALRLTLPSTNNEAKYEALLAGLRIAWQMNISNIEVKVDSKLVASQINGSYEASKDNMIKYLAKVKKYTSGFKSFLIENILGNIKENVLSKLASVPFNHLTKECLEEGIWPKDKNKARYLRAKIGQYIMKSRILFKKGYLVPMLRCVGPLQANYVIREIYIGSCGMHVGPHVVVRKAIKQGYYWPTKHKDAKKELEKLRHGHPWTTTTNERRFGLPRIIITDNRAQLVNDPFKSWCEMFKIHQMNTAVAHPQVNGLVEKANISLMEGIKTRLERERVGRVDNEAVILAEIYIPTYRTLMIMEKYNEKEMRLNLDLLQDRSEAAAVREARYKTKMKQYYNKKVHPLGFRPREFVF
uniref:Integrase catalytic domain-containing protein n=1 Tax=Tanacetum cinerariifolium TaxID=118510 RepID=A0A6L2NNB2_TANCI|nr:hypothetical protein [Tanacetum cinerariifolium]